MGSNIACLDMMSSIHDMMTKPITSSYTFKGIATELPNITSEYKDGDIIMVGDKTYAFVSNSFHELYSCADEEDERANIITSIECKCCGSHSATKISPREYRCDYCDSIIRLS